MAQVKTLLQRGCNKIRIFDRVTGTQLFLGKDLEKLSKYKIADNKSGYLLLIEPNNRDEWLNLPSEVISLGCYIYFQKEYISWDEARISSLIKFIQENRPEYEIK